MKNCFLTQRGPRAIGPYSTATVHGNTCYLSGMLGVNPETGSLAGTDVESQAKQALENMKTVLQELGLTMGAVLKTTVFLADLNDFGCMNAIYADFFGADFFGADFPARSCVQVARLPMDALVEVEAVAAMD